MLCFLSLSYLTQIYYTLPYYYDNHYCFIPNPIRENLIFRENFYFLSYPSFNSLLLFSFFFSFIFFSPSQSAQLSLKRKWGKIRVRHCGKITMVVVVYLILSICLILRKPLQHVLLFLGFFSLNLYVNFFVFRSVRFLDRLKVIIIIINVGLVPARLTQCGLGERSLEGFGFNFQWQSEKMSASLATFERPRPGAPNTVLICLCIYFLLFYFCVWLLRK